MLDAYSIRKAVPRLLIAVIGINLSIYLCVAAIDLTNILGRGLMQMITAPFIDANTFKAIVPESNVENNVVGGLLVGGAVLAGFVVVILAQIGALGAGLISVMGLLLPIVVTASLIAMAVLFTLIIRTALLVFLTIVSPVAIACFVLPGTEKYFQKWMDLFGRTLMVYPIIAVIFAMSNVMAAIILNGASGGGSMFGFQVPTIFAQAPGDAIGLVQIFAAVLVLYAPLVLIPFAFKLAGGAFAALANAASGRAGNMAGRMGQKIQRSREDPNSFLGKSKNKAYDRRMQEGFTAASITSGIGGMASAARRRQNLAAGYKLASGARGTEHSMKRFDDILKSDAARPVVNNDDYLEAARQFTNPQDMKRYLMEEQHYSERDADQGVAAIQRWKGTASNQEIQRAAAVQIAGTGTGYKKGGPAEMNRAIIQAANGDSVLEGNMVAMSRQKGQEANRVDLYGAGFGTHMRELVKQRKAIATNDPATIAATEAEVNKNMTDNALYVKGAGAIAGARGDAVKIMVPALRRRMDHAAEGMRIARQSGNAEAIQLAERNMKRVLASSSALHTLTGQVAPENQHLIADGVMDYAIHADPEHPELTATGQELIETLKTDPEFGQMVYQFHTNMEGEHSAAMLERQRALMEGGKLGGLQDPRLGGGA